MAWACQIMAMQGSAKITATQNPWRTVRRTMR
jgi:hypothetical protein